MPIATNPDTGDTVYLDTSGQWKPAKTAVNPDTKEMMAFDGKDWQKVTTHGHGVLNYIDDAVRSLASGMTFGYADKIAAKMDELTGRGGSYEKNIVKERARTEEIPSAIKIPGEIAGAVASGVALAPEAAAVSAATGISKLPAIAKAALGGAGGGALFGAGTTDSGFTDTIVNAAEGAGVGALGGAALGGAGRVISHIRNPGARAEAELQRAIGRGGGLTGSVPAGKESVATLADTGDEAVKGLLEKVAQTPSGRAVVEPVLTERQQGQLTRIAGDLKELTGTKDTSIQALEKQIKTRNETAAPLYKQAFDIGDRPIWSNELERISAVPEVQSAMHSAVTGWQRSQIAAGYGAMNPGAKVERGGILKFLNGKVPVSPNLQFWDYTKNALDDMISAEIKDDGTITKKGRDLTIIVNKLREQLDAAVPQYADARNAWAGPSSYIKSLKLGKSIRSSSPEEVSSAMAGMSEADKEAYRIGAVTDIINTMGSSTAKLPDVTRALSSPNMRGKISALMPNAQAAAKWGQRLKFESGSSELTARALGGSQTARRLFGQEDSNTIVGDLIMDTFNGRPPLGLFAKAIKGVSGAVRDTVRGRTDAALAKRLLGGPSPLQPQ